MTTAAHAGEIDRHGFAIVEGVLGEVEIGRLLAALGGAGDSRSALLRRGEVFAVRNLLDLVPAISGLAASAGVRDLVEPVLGEQLRPVRGILFDKPPGANWKAPWHQDLTIAVEERVEAEGFGPWSLKAGVLHVQPPASVLERMISVRIHLDPCRRSNGALRVIPGSHRLGRIPEAEIPAVRRAAPERICEVDAGGVLLMRPLLLHASAASEEPAHRRVVHLDFAATALPAGMRWAGSRTAPADVPSRARAV